MPFRAKWRQNTTAPTFSLFLHDKTNDAMDTNELYKKLQEELIKKVGRTMESPNDFVFLAQKIFEETKVKISETTLKRFFGYITPAGELRTSSLSAMARYLGYSGWSTFCNGNYSESNFIADKCINSSDLKKGDRVIFEWKPDRRCIVEYLDENRFLVIHAEQCKLEVGDQFTVTQFVLNNPLVISGLKQARIPQSAPKSYVAGYKTGLTALSLMKK